MITVDSFLAELRRQRADDHRFYHQSRINQTLHLISAISFLAAYALVFTQPLTAVLIGWGIGMVTRQTGHYVFEPSGYDAVNQATNAHKEKVKVGFNQTRKTVLIAIWLLAPLVLLADPSLLGLVTPHTDRVSAMNNVAIVWLAIALGGILFRSVQLWLTRSALTAVVWVTKIATDPFHNIHIYWKSPYYLLRGQLFDPIHDEDDAGDADDEPAHGTA
jgi:hypothetical protein